MDYFLESMLISDYMKEYGEHAILTGVGVPGSCFDEDSLRGEMLPSDMWMGSMIMIKVSSDNIQQRKMKY